MDRATATSERANRLRDGMSDALDDVYTIDEIAKRIDVDMADDAFREWLRTFLKVRERL